MCWFLFQVVKSVPFTSLQSQDLGKASAPMYLARESKCAATLTFPHLWRHGSGFGILITHTCKFSCLTHICMLLKHACPVCVTFTATPQTEEVASSVRTGPGAGGGEESSVTACVVKKKKRDL